MRRLFLIALVGLLSACSTGADQAAATCALFRDTAKYQGASKQNLPEPELFNSMRVRTDWGIDLIRVQVVGEDCQTVRFGADGLASEVECLVNVYDYKNVLAKLQSDIDSGQSYLQGVEKSALLAAQVNEGYTDLHEEVALLNQAYAERWDGWIDQWKDRLTIYRGVARSSLFWLPSFLFPEVIDDEPPFIGELAAQVSKVERICARLD